MRVIVAGGGTGGHLFPAVAVGSQIARMRPSAKVMYVGTINGFEAKWLPASGYCYELLDVHGVMGHSLVGRVRALAEFLRAIGMARKLMGRFRPHLVISAGGYASAPTVVAAMFARVPIVMMEQNTRPGLSNRMLWRFARKICVSFADTAQYFSRAKVEVTGLPVRYQPQAQNSGKEFVPKQILVLGGSSGAHRLNIGALEGFKILRKSVINLKVVHQSGEADAALLRDAYHELPLVAEVVPFVDDVPAVLARADLVVARAGAGTVNDVALAARPAIFVPYPFHRDMQQLHNARVLEKLGGAIIVKDDDELAPNLAREMKRLLESPKLLAEMGQRSHRAAIPDAAVRVAKICLEAAAAEN